MTESTSPETPARLQCTRCGEDKPATTEFFYRNGPRLRRICKACRKPYHQERYRQDSDAVKARSRAWEIANPEAVLASRRRNAPANNRRAQKWQQENPERSRAWHRAARQKNPERYLEYVREWTRRHPERNRTMRAEIAHRRRARMAGLPSEDIDLVALLVEHGRWCYLCEREISLVEMLEFDHVVPIARGGGHVVGNVRPTPRHCNRRKSDRLIAELPLPFAA